jgi:hypothetical protein
MLAPIVPTPTIARMMTGPPPYLRVWVSVEKTHEVAHEGNAKERDAGFIEVDAVK